MSIELTATKIDPTGKGITPLADTPALSAEEMKAKFDQLPRECVEEINKIIDDLLTLKTAITNAVGVVIPKTTALLRGDGEGNVQEAVLDTVPAPGSGNPITSGAVYAALENKHSSPTVLAGEVAASSTTSLEENHVYFVELGAFDLTIDAVNIIGNEGAHVFIDVISDDASVTLLNTFSECGDSLEGVAAGQCWEISVFKQRAVIVNTTT